MSGTEPGLTLYARQWVAELRDHRQVLCDFSGRGVTLPGRPYRHDGEIVLAFAGASIEAGRRHYAPNLADGPITIRTPGRGSGSRGAGGDRGGLSRARRLLAVYRRTIFSGVMEWPLEWLSVHSKPF